MPGGVFKMSVNIYVGDLSLRAANRPAAQSLMRGFIEEEVKQYLDGVNWEEELKEEGQEESAPVAPEPSDAAVEQLELAVHHADCPGPEMCTLDSDDPLERGVARGWKVGTVIEGEQFGRMVRLEIEYLDVPNDLVVVREFGSTMPSNAGWILNDRCWSDSDLVSGLQVKSIRTWVAEVCSSRLDRQLELAMYWGRQLAESKGLPTTIEAATAFMVQVIANGLDGDPNSGPNGTVREWPDLGLRLIVERLDGKPLTAVIKALLAELESSLLAVTPEAPSVLDELSLAPGSREYYDPPIIPSDAVVELPRPVAERHERSRTLARVLMALAQLVGFGEGGITNLSSSHRESMAAALRSVADLCDEKEEASK